MDFDRLMAALACPDAFPDGGEVEQIQTHASLVCLVGEYAYKVKKPVDFGFLNYSTLERRHEFCRAETQLNRRLAPDVYLGVVPIVACGDGVRVEHELDGEGTATGPVVEWAVLMRRLPQHATLEARLRAGLVTRDDIEQLAGLLAAFHRRAARSPEISTFAALETVAANARENFELVRQQVGRAISEPVFERLQQTTETALQACAPTIEARALEGRACDTHGDLRLEHVYCFPEVAPPHNVCIVDCIEFNHRFRYADPLADVAFLAMDLETHGAWELAAVLMRAYLAAADERDDAGLAALIAFYTAYRATVRGKVEGLKADEDEVPAELRSGARAKARAHYLVALGKLEPPARRPCVVVVFGLPGTGKSTLSLALERSGGFTWIRSDVVRKQLAGLDPETSAATEFGEGIYSESWNVRTYEACLERAAEVLFAGGRVVLDANFKQDAWRRRCIELAREWGVPIRFLECRVPAPEVHARLALRAEHRADASDATAAIYDAAAREFEPVSPEVERRRDVIDASQAERAAEAAVQRLTACGLL